MQNKIPKVIHYCWFGGNPLSEEAKKCIGTWKEHMPDYDIIEWNESNYDYNKIQFTKQAYKEKKWAFVSDYARLDIIYNYGGIYLDTDVEVLKSFDDLLTNDAFMGIENGGYVNTGIGFGAKRNHEGIRLNKEIYEGMSIYDKDGNINLINCPLITTELLKQNGAEIKNKIEKVLGITIYTVEYFCPMDYNTGKINTTTNSYSIHRYSMSWVDRFIKKQIRIERGLNKFFGRKFSHIVSKIIILPSKILFLMKTKGLIKTVNFCVKKVKRR